MQIRKILFTIAGLILSTSAGYALSSQDDIIAALFDANKVSSNYNSDSKEIAMLSKGEEPFKNLYLFMYQNVKQAPKEAAIDALLNYNSEYSTFSRDDLIEIATNGNLDRLANQYASDGEIANIGNIAQATLVNAYTKIMADYTEELELQRQNRTLSYENMAQEIFMNHDLSDSANIDLLYDFDLINYLLFGNYIEVPDRAGNTSVNLSEDSTGSEAKGIGSAKAAGGAASRSEAEGIGSAKAAGGAASRSEAEGIGSSSVKKLAKVKRSTEADHGDTSSPYCSEESEISKAVKEYEIANPKSVEKENGGGAKSGKSEGDYSTGGSRESSSGSEKASDSVDASTAGFANSKTSGQAKTLDDFEKQISGSIGNWERALPCDEIFCVTIELVEENSKEEYAETDNCIACHVEYILKRMDETTGKSMVASKVPMNVFEDATCKKAGNNIGINLNVYAVKKPIFTSAATSTPESAANNVNELRSELAANRSLISADTITGKTANDIDAERILYDSGNSSQAEILEKILEANNSKIAELDQIFNNFELNARAQNYQDFERQVLEELATFKSYFEAFEEKMKETLTPLQSLTEKKVCE